MVDGTEPSPPWTPQKRRTGLLSLLCWLIPALLGYFLAGVLIGWLLGALAHP